MGHKNRSMGCWELKLNLSLHAHGFVSHGYIPEVHKTNAHHLVMLRVSGVIWLVAHVLQLLLISFIQQNLSCINKSTMKLRKKLDLLWITYGYWKCTFVDSLIEYIGHSNCVHGWVWSSQSNLKMQSDVLKTCIFIVFDLLILTEPYLQSNIGVWSRKVTK